MEREAAIALLKRSARLRHAHRRRLHIAAIVGGALIVIAGLTGGAWALMHRSNWPDPQLVAVAKAAAYPIYFPSQLPKGFSDTASSVTNSNGVFIYALTYDGNKKLYVSAVPKPTGVQFDDFYNRILTNKQNVQNTAGTAVIGNANNQPVGSLVTDKTWVTMNAPKGLDTPRLQTLVSSLKQL